MTGSLYSFSRQALTDSNLYGTGWLGILFALSKEVVEERHSNSLDSLIHFGLSFGSSGDSEGTLAKPLVATI